MSRSATLHSYFAIIQKLQTKCYPTKEELIAHVEKQLEIFRNKDGKAEKGISVRSFERDKKAIYDLFGIQIKHSRKHNGYYIAESVGQQHFLQQMAQSFEALQLLNLSTHLQNAIIPQPQVQRGIEHFGEILSAIRDQKQLQFTYHKYWDDHSTERTVAPYHLKEAGNRWYLIAKDVGSKEMYINQFGLDRMSSVWKTTTSFTPPTNHSYLAIYQYTFGIDGPHNNNDKVEEVILSFEHYQGKYVKALPLHHTQQVVVDDGKELRIRLQLYLSYDFKMQILAHGKNVKVLAPQSLANEIKYLLTASLKQYQSCTEENS